MRIVLISTLFWAFLISCGCQSNKQQVIPQNSKGEIVSNIVKTENNGIIYFSDDVGLTWYDASAGLPKKLSIGLGGISTSENKLAMTTKESGVYVYDEEHKAWSIFHINQDIVKANIGALMLYNSTFFLGTQDAGVYCSNDNGITWSAVSDGLGNTTIRRFSLLNNKLHVCTNDGFYYFNSSTKKWHLLFGEEGLQVNGAVYFKDATYLATNKGIYSNKAGTNWKNILTNHSVHNVNADKKDIYAMTYNELLLSSTDGTHWQSKNQGLPALYTFNVLETQNRTFAAQWDGVYVKSPEGHEWLKSSSGLPPKFAVTNLKGLGNKIIAATSERK